jgi:hypothetical protein
MSYKKGRLLRSFSLPKSFRCVCGHLSKCHGGLVARRIPRHELPATLISYLMFDP